MDGASPTIARLIGGAGTGKTTRLLDLMGKAITAGGLEPEQVGFVSFTRAARAVATSRAAERFGCQPADLEGAWFRTLHSICYRVLEVRGDTLIAGTAADRKWLAEVLDASPEAVAGGVTAAVDAGDATEALAAMGEASRALALWDAARSRLEPLAATYDRLGHATAGLPDLADVRALVERYESAKLVHGRVDFTDLLLQFAGFRARVEGVERVSPLGWVPQIDVWFLDEQQDTSRLLDAVCHRLIAPSRWVYVVGDPYQSIYGFAGADGSLFQAWPAAKQEVMPKSYRCPAPILALGERLLAECSDYWDRGIAPADHDGEVVEEAGIDSLAGIDARDSWLVIARSNWHARRLAGVLDRAGVPWVPTRGGGRWAAPSRHAGLQALRDLALGRPIDGEQWRAAVKILPSTLGGDAILVRGAKKLWEEAKGAAERHPWVMLADLEEMGATPRLVGMLANGSWRLIVEHGDTFDAACDRWGEEVVHTPRVKVGTIHSVKGEEADNVFWLTTTSEQVSASAASEQGRNEEQRVGYVAATRARKRLVVAKERSRWQSKVEI